MSQPALDVRADGQVIVTGSLAYDNIMTFPGFFKDHILPEKIHAISISFLVKEMRKQRGGCAANIAYSLALLGQEARIIAAAGNDFDEYRQWLIGEGIDVEAIHTVADEPTASCHITTDQSNNQITGFYVGAMPHAAELSLSELAGDRAALVIVAPDDPVAMVRHCREARQIGLPCLFDPSFQVTAMDGGPLTKAAQGAAALVVNDYEYAVFQQKTGKSGEDLFDLVNMVIVTLGADGSRIQRRGEAAIEVTAAKISDVIDPTGAGDAFRSGFVAGLVQGRDLETCGRMGSVTAAFAIEHHGPQNHRYTVEEFHQRYAANFGMALSA